MQLIHVPRLSHVKHPSRQESQIIVEVFLKEPLGQL